MGLNILIIDDDQVNNFVLKNIIQRSYPDARVEVKLEGQSALNYLGKVDDDRFPQIILLDIYMPILNGYDFLEQFHSVFSKKDCYIYMISTSLSKNDQQRANNYPMVQGFITKPLINNNIQSIVDHYRRNH